uniref:Uncharacterized protein n=1 Tax=Oryza nivara TaxID=4536 RepID=A0A0E0HU59_ORYNI
MRESASSSSPTVHGKVAEALHIESAAVAQPDSFLSLLAYPTARRRRRADEVEGERGRANLDDELLLLFGS